MKLRLAAALVLAPALLAAAPQRHAAHRTDWTRTVVVTAEGGYRMGNPNAPVKLIEYGARTCPSCARFDREATPALTAYVARGSVSWEYRDFPVHGAVDFAPILLGRCVSPAQYFPVLHGMMAEQQALIGRPTPLTDAEQKALQGKTANQIAAILGRAYGYTDFARRRGMSPARIAACLADRPALEAIAKRADEAGTKYGVSGTPTFLINGQTALAIAGWSDLEPLLRAAGAK